MRRQTPQELAQLSAADTRTRGPPQCHRLRVVGNAQTASLFPIVKRSTAETIARPDQLAAPQVQDEKYPCTVEPLHTVNPPTPIGSQREFSVCGQIRILGTE